MNDVMSMGLHRLFKDTFVDLLPWRHLPQHFSYLDMACGSGDITQRVLQRAKTLDKTCTIFMCDPNPDMMNQGKQRLGTEDKTFLEDPAENVSLPSSSIDLYTISFGLRNVTDRQKALKEAHRLLTPEGFFYCLEFTMPSHPFVKVPYKLYLDVGLPLMGAVVAKNRQAYQYLSDSIQSFPSPFMLDVEMKHAGFSDIGHQLLGQGIMAIHWGKK